MLITCCVCRSYITLVIVFFFSSRRRHTRLVSDWSSDVCSSDLGPAAVVADAHAKDAVEHAPDREAEVAGLEIALFQMLVAALRVVFGMAGQVHLAVAADDRPVATDEDRKSVV